MPLRPPPIQSPIADKNNYFPPQVWIFWFQEVARLIASNSAHGDLTGLLEDDHTQYHNDTRGDIRYYKKSEVDAALLLKQDVIDSVVFVRSASDFSGGIDSSKTYFVDGAIDMGSTQIKVPEGGVSIVSDDLNIKGLYSSSNNYTMFVKDDTATYAGNVTLRNMFLAADGTNSKIVDLDNNGNSGAFECLNVNIGNFGFGDTAEIGEVTAYRQVRFNGCGFINCDDGLTLSGTMSGGVVVQDSIALSLPAMTLFKEGTSLLIQGIFRSNINFLSVDAAAVFCDFQPSNIDKDAGFSLTNVTTSATDIVPNFPENNVKAKFANCRGIRNTYVGGRWTISTGAETTISASGTYYKMAGVTDYTDLEWFSQTVDNSFVYDSEQVIEVKCSGVLSFSGGGNDQIGIKFRKFDNSTSSYVEGAEFVATLNGGPSGVRAENIVFKEVFGISEGDRIEVWIANKTDTSNIASIAGGLVDIGERAS